MELRTSAALLAPSRKSLSYPALCHQIAATNAFLNNHGLGRNDRIGVLLPDSPELAALFLGIIAGSTFVPLSPDLRSSELAAAIDYLQLKALVVAGGTAVPLEAAAGIKNLSVIELVANGNAEAGVYRLQWKSENGNDHGEGICPAPAPIPQRGVASGACLTGFSGPEDIALVLTTSGTTARPKIVPLSHAVIFASVQYLVSSLGLTGADRCLNMLPMAHVAGLITPILATLASGGSVVCTSGFSADRFAAWLEACRPTWYSAVPAMHQAIIEKAEAGRLDLSQSSLRFVRSTSSPLFSRLQEDLVRTFKLPVYQSYGMTEALPIAGTPLNALPGKAASVGIPVSEVRVVGEGGRPEPPGVAGEIVLRGPQVFGGYEHDPAANEAAFVDGWFRTGDIGYRDEDGYLYVTGRLKEMINRGGQKISPEEVESSLMSHPAVREAAVFRTAHRRLGEIPVAAVVLAPGQEITEQALLHYLTEQLALYKIPQQVLITASLPKGPSGKFNRAALSELFFPLLESPFAAPENETEKRLAGIWRDLLGVDSVGRRDNFFSLGGDSMMTVGLFSQIEEVFGLALPQAMIYEASTLEKLAAVITIQLGGEPSSRFILLRPGEGPPLVCISPLADPLLIFHTFLRHLTIEQPVYGFEPDERTLDLPLEETAGVYIAEIRALVPDGPFLLLGFSSGGLLAFEMARQLAELGLPIRYLGILDTSCLSYVRSDLHTPLLRSLGYFVRNLPYWAYFYLPICLGHYGRQAMSSLTGNAAVNPGLAVDPVKVGVKRVKNILAAYSPKRAPVDITFYRAKAQALLMTHPDMGWGCLSRRVRIRHVLGTHLSLVREPHVRQLAARISEDLRNLTDPE